MTLTTLGFLAFQYVNIPYKWAGNDPLVGLDCSGFIQLPLQEAGVLPRNVDRSAQMIFDYIKEGSYTSEVGPDSLLFYGESEEKITHVALMLSDNLMIEAGGGSRDCHDIYDAVRRNARVKVVPVRDNFVACVRVKYNL